MRDAPTTLALDLATKTGWAVRGPKRPLLWGAYRLLSDTPMSYATWESWLRELIAETMADRLAIEAPVIVKARPNWIAWKLRGVAESVWGKHSDAPILSLSPTALKRFAGASASEGKSGMVRAASLLWGIREPLTGDEADALCLLSYAESVGRNPAIHREPGASEGMRRSLRARASKAPNPRAIPARSLDLRSDMRDTEKRPAGELDLPGKPDRNRSIEEMRNG